jgi:hypothetical protein
MSSRRTPTCSASRTPRSTSSGAGWAHTTGGLPGRVVLHRRQPAVRRRLHLPPGREDQDAQGGSATRRSPSDRGRGGLGLPERRGQPRRGPRDRAAGHPHRPRRRGQRRQARQGRARQGLPPRRVGPAVPERGPGELSGNSVPGLGDAPPRPARRPGDLLGHARPQAGRRRSRPPRRPRGVRGLRARPRDLRVENPGADSPSTRRPRACTAPSRRGPRDRRGPRTASTTCARRSWTRRRGRVAPRAARRDPPRARGPPRRSLSEGDPTISRRQEPQTPASASGSAA